MGTVASAALMLVVGLSFFQIREKFPKAYGVLMMGLSAAIGASFGLIPDFSMANVWAMLSAAFGMVDGFDALKRSNKQPAPVTVRQ